MSVAFDATSESHTGNSGSTSAASFSWSHPTTSRVKGILAYTFTNANADDATAVSFNGQSLSAVNSGRAVATGDEPGDCKAWFSGSSISQAPTSNGVWLNPSGASSYSGFLYDIVVDGQNIAATSSNSGYLIFYSTSGVTGTWNAIDSTTLPLSIVFSLTTDGNNWMAAGYNSIGNGKIYYASSLSGTWTDTTPASTNGSFQVVYGNGYWLTVGYSTTATTAYYSTSLGGTWSTMTGFSDTNFEPTKLKYFSSIKTFVLTGFQGKIYYTKDPTGTWLSATGSGFTSSDNVRDINYNPNDGMFVAVSNNGKIRYTTNLGGTWLTPSASGFSNSTFIYGIATDGKVWVAASTSSTDTLRTTTDVSGTWSSITVTLSGNASATKPVTRLVTDGVNWYAGMGGNSAYLRYFVPQITVTRTNNAHVMYGVAATVTADTDTSVVGTNKFEGVGSSTDLSLSISDSSPGTDSLRFAGINSGLNAVVLTTTTTAADTLVKDSNSTALQSIDFGTRVAGVVRETTAGQGSRSVGFNSETSEDAAVVALAVYEAPPTTYSSSFTGWGIPVR